MKAHGEAKGAGKGQKSWRDRGNVDIGDLRYDDVETFVNLYAHAKDGVESYEKLAAGVNKKHQAMALHLARVVGAFCEPMPPRDAVRLLFEFEAGKKGLVRPTEVAIELQKWLRSVGDVYKRARAEVKHVREGGDRPVELRIGSSQTLGLYLLPYMLSGWDGVCGGRVRLRRVEIRNSRELIYRVTEGLLDCLLAMGLPGDGHDREMGVTFEPLGFEVRTVLLAHPEGIVHLRDGNANANASYWKKFHDKDRKKRPNYDQLKPITLEEIDWKQTALFAVPSWRQPEELRKHIEEAKGNPFFMEVDTYDEAIAHVRMLKRGVTTAAEAFAKRRAVTAFRVVPEERYTRLAGVYYRDDGGGPSRGVRLLIDFMKAYMGEFAQHIQDTGEAPGLDDEKYVKNVCTPFKDSIDWSSLEFSTRKNGGNRRG